MQLCTHEWCACVLYNNLCMCFHCLGEWLAIKKVSLDVGSYFLLPSVSIIQQLLLVVEQLLVCLCGELKVGSLGGEEGRRGGGGEKEGKGRKGRRRQAQRSNKRVYTPSLIPRSPQPAVLRPGTKINRLPPSGAIDSPLHRNITLKKAKSEVYTTHTPLLLTLTDTPPQWRPQDRPPGKIHSRCTWSCQCHTAWFFYFHLPAPQLQL